MIAVITSEIRQGIPSSGIQFCFWGALVVYASIKLRSLILISRDQVVIFNYNLYAFLTGICIEIIILSHFFVHDRVRWKMCFILSPL